MCGILGIIGSFSEDTLLKCSNRQSHRGPDDNGIFIHQNLAFAHHRLSVIDVSSRGHQPLLSEDKEYAIIYNGEIYNHRELRKLLEPKYKFKSESDTETLLYGFIEFGKEILNKVNGIFSFAIFHKATGNLFIARDHSGIKPLYYYYHNTLFAFASELKSIQGLPDFYEEINHEALSDYIHLLYSPGTSTPFKKVKKLLPGHYLELNISSPGSYSIHNYYNYTYPASYKETDEKKLIVQLEEKLNAAIEKQLMSDVPVGFFLSGGVDSSGIVAMVRRNHPSQKIQCFTIDSGDTSSSEGVANDFTYAHQVANYLKVDLEVVPGEVNILQDFDKMIYHLDEPIADPAALHVYNISKKASEMGCKVLISGAGADEVFSGYRRHQALILEKVYGIIPPAAFTPVPKILKFLGSKSASTRRIQKLFSSLHSDKTQRMLSLYSWLPPSTVKNLFCEELRKELEPYNPFSYFLEIKNQLPKPLDDLSLMLFWDRHTYLPDNNLLYTDKMSMANGVEVRVPYLDKELLEFTASIPPHLKMRGVTTKYLLRQVLKKYLPASIIDRPKTGFGAPVRKWISHDLKPLINQYLSLTAIEKRGIFNSHAIQELISKNDRGEIDASYSIWALLAIESWMRQFHDSQ